MSRFSPIVRILYLVISHLWPPSLSVMQAPPYKFIRSACMRTCMGYSRPVMQCGPNVITIILYHVDKEHVIVHGLVSVSGYCTRRPCYNIIIYHTQIVGFVYNVMGYGHPM